MEIRKAEACDADMLFTLNTLFENDADEEHIRESLANNDREIVCLALEGGEAVGFGAAVVIQLMCYGNNRADIETLFVKEAYRGQGAGAAMLAFLEKELAARGISHFHICVNARNAAARSLYTKAGYCETGELLLHKTRR